MIRKKPITSIDCDAVEERLRKCLAVLRAWRRIRHGKGMQSRKELTADHVQRLATPRTYSVASKNFVRSERRSRKVVTDTEKPRSRHGLPSTVRVAIGHVRAKDANVAGHAPRLQSLAKSGHDLTGFLRLTITCKGGHDLLRLRLQANCKCGHDCPALCTRWTRPPKGKA